MKRATSAIDERDGVFSNLTVNRSGSRYLFDANASHIGYAIRSTRHLLGPKVTFGFQWVSLPLNFGYITRTPFATNGTTLTLDDNIQRAVQGRQTPPTMARWSAPCAPALHQPRAPPPRKRLKRRRRRPAITRWRTPSTCATAATPRSFGLTYAATTSVDIDAGFTTAKRDGAQPWGASFAFNDAVEVPLPSTSGPTTQAWGLVVEHQVDVPRRMGRIVVHQRVRESRVGQPDPHHRFQ